MKKIYGCDIWDGFCNVFNKAVTPLGRGVEKGVIKLFNSFEDGAASKALELTGKVTGVTAVWNALSGNHLLEKHHLDKMESDEAFGVRMIGGIIGMMVMSPLARIAMDVPSRSSTGALLGFAMMGLGLAMGTLPRNAYVACKAQKEQDMRRDEAKPAAPSQP